MLRLMSFVMLLSVSLVSTMPQSSTTVTQKVESATPIVATPASKLDHNDDAEHDHTHAEPETETEPYAESEAEPEAESEAEPDSKVEPEPEAEAESEPEVEPESESEPYPEAEPEKVNQPQVAKVEPGLAHPAVTKGERQPKNAQAPLTQPVKDNRNSVNNLAGGAALSLVFAMAPL